MLQKLLERLLPSRQAKTVEATQEAATFWYPNPRHGIEPMIIYDWRITGDYLTGTEPGVRHQRDFHIRSISSPNYALAKALLNHPAANRSISRAHKAGHMNDPSRLP